MQDKQIQDLTKQVENLKQAMSLVSRRLVAAEHRLSKTAEITRRQADALVRLERLIKGGQ